MMTTARMNRRQFFGELGKSSFVIGFSLSPMAASILAQEAHAASLDSQLTVLSDIASGNPAQNDAWLTIDHQGNITLFSGKVEIGTGIQTAFSQIVAEELYVDASMIGYVQGDTSQTPDQGFTAGSKSIQVQGPLVRRAAATAYQQLVALANGQGITLKTGPKNNYAKLFAGHQMDPSNYTVVGQPVARLDLTNKCTGTFPFVSDIVLPGMLHGRVLRNVNGGSATKPKNATFSTFDAGSFAAAQAIPGFVQTVQKGNFVGVVATTEWGAIQAAKTLQVVWTAGPALVSVSDQATLQAALMSPTNIYATSTQEVVGNADLVFSTAPIQGTRMYYSPYHMHGSVGPSCAVANITSTPRRQRDPGDSLVGYAGRIPVAAGPFRYPGDSDLRDQGRLRRGRGLLRPQWFRRRGR